MKLKIFWLLFILFGTTLVSSAEPINNRIVLVADFSDDPSQMPALGKEAEINVMNLLDENHPVRENKTIYPLRSAYTYKWVIEDINQRTLVYSSILGTRSNNTIVPGDSIYMRFKKNGAEFSGIGFLKFKIWYEIVSMQNKLPTTKRPRNLALLSLSEYLTINQNCNLQLNNILPLIESYKSDLTLEDYTRIKFDFIYELESARLNAFIYISPIDFPLYGVTATAFKDKKMAWDTTMYNAPAKWLRSQHDMATMSASYFYSFSREVVWKQGHWRYPDQPHSDTLFLKPARVKAYYDNIEREYSGLRLEQVLTKGLLEEEVIKEMGIFHPVTRQLLQRYYAGSKFSNYRKWVESKALLNFERRKERENELYTFEQFPVFQLEDSKGGIYTPKNISRKFAVLNFWQSGSSDCRQMAVFLNGLQEKFKNDTNVVFINIGVDNDKDVWKRNLGAGVYSPKGGVHLYAGAALKENRSLLEDFGVVKYPFMTFITADHPKQLQITAKEGLTLDRAKDGFYENYITASFFNINDGPYVLGESNNKKAIYFTNGVVEEQRLPSTVEVATDKFNKILRFPLKKKSSIPASNYSSVSKMLVLSDIEGNFSAFRQLLQVNKVIDSNYDWIFGTGHLVIAGDVFDRGINVTESLWLIYSLEERAKAAGGGVHFILGNHEIMNLAGDHLQYVHKKYTENAKLIQKKYAELYSDETELGKWLRTKNMMEIVGDNLFLHAGVSRELNQLPLTIQQINDLGRPHFDDTTNQYSDDRLNIIMSSKIGPFWYRGYYKDKNQEGLIDSTLQKFGVKHIITGHTIVSDTITTHFNNKVINTDTPHSKGSSEALLIEGTKYYRVNDNGYRRLLFDDADKKNHYNKSSIQNK